MTTARLWDICQPESYSTRELQCHASHNARPRNQFAGTFLLEIDKRLSVATHCTNSVCATGESLVVHNGTTISIQILSQQKGRHIKKTHKHKHAR